MFLLSVVTCAVVIALFFLLPMGLGVLMATVQELKESIASVAAGVDGLEASVKELKEKVAAGGVASQADLDALSDAVKAIGADIADTSDQ